MIELFFRHDQKQRMPEDKIVQKINWIDFINLKRSLEGKSKRVFIKNRLLQLFAKEK